MRERGRKPQALIGRKMVHFSSKAKYDGWFEEEIDRRLQHLDPSKSFTSEEVFAYLDAEAIRENLVAKLSRRAKCRKRK